MASKTKKVVSPSRVTKLMELYDYAHFPFLSVASDQVKRELFGQIDRFSKRYKKSKKYLSAKFELTYGGEGGHILTTEVTYHGAAARRDKRLKLNKHGEKD